MLLRALTPNGFRTLRKCSTTRFLRRAAARLAGAAGPALMAVLIPARAPAQQPSVGPAAAPHRAPWSIVATVDSLGGKRLADATVRFDVLGPGDAQTCQTDRRGECRVEFDLHAAPKRQLWAALTATHDDYLDAHDVVRLPATPKTLSVELALRNDEPEKSDAHQLSFSQLLAGVQARLRAPAASKLPPGRDLEDYQTAAGLLFDDAEADEAEALLERLTNLHPACAACRTLMGLALVARGGWSSAVRELQEAAWITARPDAPLHRPEPFLVLAVLAAWRGQERRSEELLLRALAQRPDDPLALEELGRIFVRERRMKAANIYLAQAIGQGAPPEAHLLRAQALAGEMRPAEAHAEMAAYLGNRKAKELAGPYRAVWSQLVERLELESGGGAAPRVADTSPTAFAAAVPELKGLEPASNQDSLPLILRRVGETVEDSLAGFTNTSSAEQIRMERLHRDGKVADSLEETFRYLFLVSHDQPDLGIREYRTDRRGVSLTPADPSGRFMITEGFATVALHFHPEYQIGSTFRYLGRETVRGRAMDVIAFAQRPETAKLIESFQVNHASTDVLIQGVAWVDPTTWQITHIRTGLLRADPQIRLTRQTTDIRYGEVRFAHINRTMWLPLQVAVTVEWNGKIFRNEHAYSDFQVFEVKTRQTIGKPQIDSPTYPN